MSHVKQPPWTLQDYEQAAREYCASLPLEHFMEAPNQAQQRKVTLESLDVYCEYRDDIQVFNELLIQYFYEGQLRRVVPDNLVCRGRQALRGKGSFNLELEALKPLLVFEYISPGNPRKDYEDNFAKYERELKVPYCLMYYPNKKDLRVWHHNGENYERLTPNAKGRLAISDLELEVRIQDGWVRYWYRGELLPLPGELLRQKEHEKQRADQEKQRADQEKQRAEQERRQREITEAEVTRLKALLAQAQAAPPNPRRRRKGK